MEKLELLLEILNACGGGVVAFSGGTDSTLLLAAAREAGIPLIAVTADSPLLPRSDREAALAVAAALEIDHRFIDAEETEHPEVRHNRADRCYHCKRIRLIALQELAASEGFPWVMEGSRADDHESARPGMRAVRELGARSPLREAAMGRGDVEEALCRLGLRRFIRPSNSCLATRFPAGHRLSAEELLLVDQAEDLLRREGFPDVRLRWGEGEEMVAEVRPSDLRETDWVLKRLESELRARWGLPHLRLRFHPARPEKERAPLFSGSRKGERGEEFGCTGTG